VDEEGPGNLIGDSEAPSTPEDFGTTDDVESPGVDPAINDNVEIPGVDEEGPEDPTPQEIEIDDDLDIHPDPIPVEAEPVQDVQEVTAQQAAPVTEPMQLPELRRSTRAKTQTQSGCVPSMTGSRCGYAVTQLESQGVLHPDAHMFVQQDLCQSEPDVVAMIMTQLSLKAGLKAWGDKAHDAVHSEMKQLHLRNTFKPKHWHESTHSQSQTVLESHMFLKEKRTGKIKGRTVTDRHGRPIGDSEAPSAPEDFGTADDVESPGVDPAINDDI
jgi:hypothetical protein